MQTGNDQPAHEPGTRRERSQALRWDGGQKPSISEPSEIASANPTILIQRKRKLPRLPGILEAENRSEPGTSAPHPEFLHCLGPGADHCDRSHTLALSSGSPRPHVPESQEHMLSPLHGKGIQGSERDEPCPRAGDKVRAEPGTQPALLDSDPTYYMSTCPRYLPCAGYFICAISSLRCPCKVIVSLIHR